MPNQYRKGTVEVTVRIPEALKEQIRLKAKSRNTSVNRFIRELLEQESVPVGTGRALNPLRGSPRHRPRDSAALLALVWNTRQHVLKDSRFRVIGPGKWKLV